MKFSANSFVWDEFYWVTTAQLPSWSGYHLPDQLIRNSNEESKTNTHKILFAPEGRGNEPLNKNELNLVRWFIENEQLVHEATLNGLYKEYPSIKNEFSEYLEDETESLLPELKNPNDLKNLLAVNSINIHQISKNNTPFIGVDFSCSWDDEHGLGVLLHGAKILEIGGADTASLLWLVEGYTNT